MSYHPLAMAFSLLHNQFYSLSHMKQDCQGILDLWASPGGKNNMLLIYYQLKICLTNMSKSPILNIIIHNSQRSSLSFSFRLRRVQENLKSIASFLLKLFPLRKTCRIRLRNQLTQQMSRAKLESIVQYKRFTKRNGNENYKKKELYYTINMKLCFGYIYQPLNLPLDCKGI